MHSNTQHGRQPPPQPAAPPTDPRIRNVPSAGTTAADSQGVCRDFVWGICSLGAQCKYRHELEFESMKAILKFCHDHQNRTGCTRSDCTYLHTSRDEENLFLTTGQIPRVLMERYTENMSSMSATPGASTSNAEPVPPVATVPPHMYDYLVQGLPPPPPPPPPAPGPNAPPQPMSMTMPSSMPPPISMPAMPAPIMLGMPGPMPPMLAPPPPPPPPPTAPVTSMRVAGPAYSAPSTSQAVAPYQPQTQPQLPVLFDPSRPPPPLPLATRKRQVEDEHEAGPSKLRKSEPNIDGSCESCVQRQIRCRMVTQQIENIEQDNDNQRMEINRKMEDYEKKKMVLKTMLRPDFYRIAEEYIENLNNAGSSNVNQFNDLMEVIFNNSMPTMNSPFNLNNSSMFPLLLQIISGNNSRGGIRDASPVPEEHNLLQVLNARPRANQNENLIMSTLLDFMSNTSERNAARDIGDNRLIDNDLNRPTSSAISNNSNGISRLINDSVSPPMSVQSSSRYANMRAIEGVPGPSGLANSRSYCESVAPAAPLPPTRAYETVPAPVPNPYETRQYLENNIVGPGNSVPYDSAGPSGVHHYADGLAGTLARPYADNGAGPSRYPPAQAAPPRQYHPGLCEGATVPQNAPPAAAPPMYVPGPYSAPTQPPVARNYYQFPQNNMANAGYPGMPAGQAPRPPAAGMPVSQAPRPPTPNMPTIPQNQQNYQHYMGRYPFYPPF